jgi:hypothetical protein
MYCVCQSERIEFLLHIRKVPGSNLGTTDLNLGTRPLPSLPIPVDYSLTILPFPGLDTAVKEITSE